MSGRLSISFVDLPDHTSLRNALGDRLSPKGMNEIQSRVQAEANALVNAVKQRGKFDGVRDFAGVFPLKIVGELIGLPTEGRNRLLAWGDANFNVMGPQNDRYERSLPVFLECFEYIKWLDQDPSRLRNGSLGSALYEAADKGIIRRDQCHPLMAAYLVAGIDTTISSIANALDLFGQNPDQWQKLRERPAMVGRAYNEILRIESPALGFKRVTRVATELAGVALPEGASVVVLYASANRDERKCADPDRFDIGRHAADHVAFGHGLHVCAGRMLARLEASAILTAMAEQVEGIEVGGRTRHLNNTVHSPTPVSRYSAISCLFNSAAILAKSERARASQASNAKARSGCSFHLSAKFSSGPLGFAIT
ncbi:cytochrome P450 [Bradyrhizobium sp. Leo170]|uniref:cytochrome P450 n=1 Tax=Bradyrhizobium sp. Leo170 TaxID=1571199 RepID=UPI00102EC6CF|nr:cytochrome P450 [Bradyrhizobium sp. Leo170]TAI61345.1 cytochrome P450 [Bradyrhizobium sp. Leo170]